MAALWLDYLQKPVWVGLQFARIDLGRMKVTESESPVHPRQGDLAAAQGQLNVGMCRKLCDQGRTPDAVDALSLLVQQGHPVGNNLFYRALKWCISSKDLALGRRIHALTVESGYEGDPFLATHLIDKERLQRLYDSID